MRFEAVETALKNGEVVTLRSMEISDAPERLRWQHAVTSETAYLARTPEEITTALDCIEEMIEDMALSPDALEISAFLGGEMVGDVVLRPVSRTSRFRHRANIGIAVKQSCWGLGLGRALLEAALAQAPQMGFEQVELEVITTNIRAIALYESLGFQHCGNQPRAFKMADGSYQDELKMYKPI